MSAETIQRTALGSQQRIPFYRNVRTIGVLAQVVFAVVLVAAAYVVYHNVTTALRSANLPSDFGFLDQRAGIPLAETPIRYTGENSYGRAFLIGVLNTLKVALVGVAFATVLGVVIGVMCLSRNFLMRGFATVYVETLRNTPLAVQIIFWYTAFLTPLPPRILNAVRLPGGALFSNQGVALPWPYPSYHFGAWVPYLVAAVAIGAAVWWLRRRQLRLADRPGNAFGPGLLAALVVAVAGYLLVGKGSLPSGAATAFREPSGVVTVFRDLNGDGVKQFLEPFIPFAAVTARVAEGGLEVQTQNLVESRRYVYGRFYFPPFQESEFEEVEVTFADPEAAAESDLAIHFFQFPSRGVVYRDRDGDGAWDQGEELDPDAPSPRGFSAAVRLSFTGFERTLVANRNGEARIPRFATTFAASESRGANVSPAQLFAPPAAAGGGEDEEEPLQAEFTIQTSRPLVWSKPTIPISNYDGGVRLSTNYLALLIALVVYTASFIAEIVRAGLLAVPNGQREAAKALGLSDSQAFRFVIFPQAMRVILPPLISQFLNLTKNSSLAPLAAYSELFAISIIIANQTGATVPVTLMIIAAYLTISLLFALVLNIVNARMALVER